MIKPRDTNWLRLPSHIGRRARILFAAVAVTFLCVASLLRLEFVRPDAAMHSYIVQASSVAASEQSVARVGGRIEEPLGVMRAVAARLSDAQADALRRLDGVTVYGDQLLRVADIVPETHYPDLVGAADLHAAGITGAGVTVAVIDTGLWHADGIEESSVEADRIIGEYDALLHAAPYTDEDDEPYVSLEDLFAMFEEDDEEIANSNDDNNDEENEGDGEGDAGTNPVDEWIDDWSGHGTHVTSVIVGSRKTAALRFQGIAPDARVVSVKAFEADGSGRYIDVIRGINYVVQNKERLGIRVLNLSFSGPPVSRYWEDPLNQAVMAAWDAGIVVVVAA